MVDQLVRTRLQPPPLRPDLLLRPSLQARLAASLESGHRLTVVGAPAGYGKTTALAQWARTNQARTAWLTLDTTDNQFDRFFRYLTMAWAAQQPPLLDSPLAMLVRGANPDPQTVLTAFLNAAHALTAPAVLVLDDYHLIIDKTIHDALTTLLDHAAANLHLVLSSRQLPPLPLARYRAAGMLMEITQADLRLEPAESQQLLHQAAGHTLPQTSATYLHEQLEGWAAGLQMAGLALQRQPADSAKLTFTSQHRFLTDYWQEELLSGQPPEVIEFLALTSPLPQLCAPLCDAVSGQTNSQALLEKLEREGLFLGPLDGQREWYRYHAWFAEFLSTRLASQAPERLRMVQQAAAVWFLEAGLPEQAFALAVAAGRADLVAHIAETHFEFMLHTGQLKLLRAWLDALPPEWQWQEPVIGLSEAQWLAFTGQVPACLAQLEQVETAIQQSERADKEWQLARARAVRCQIACFNNDLATAEPLAAQALSTLPGSDYHFRVSVHHALGEAYRQAARWAEARNQLTLALTLPPPGEQPIRATHIYGALADVALQQGQLRSAAEQWHNALAYIEKRESWGQFPLPLIGWVHIRLAELHYEWNDLDAARQHSARGLAIAEAGGATEAMLAGNLIASRLQLTLGDLPAAIGYLEKARPLAQQSHFHGWRARLNWLQAELWLAQDAGSKPQASAWLNATLATAAMADNAPDELNRLAAARLLLARKETQATETALTLLHELERQAAAAGRRQNQIRALTLQALARGQAGLPALAQALQLAEPEGYQRLFVDLGLPLLHLLRRFRQRDVRADYVDQLLAAAGTTPGSAVNVALPDPLTAREEQILGLLAAGLTNQEIAAQLVISPETVKRHARHIYGKLHVSNRTEAAARARALGLLA
ncbi:MAG: hypothetical protein KDE34_10775 [Anaerolineales bacterium]|nr:hypothetical protein [Anaerolineales bacterium]